MCWHTGRAAPGHPQAPKRGRGFLAAWQHPQRGCEPLPPSEPHVGPSWKCLTHPARSRGAQTHRLLLVLEHFLDLLIAADLLDALPLDGALPNLLQEAVGSGEALQDRVGIPGPQEHCKTRGTDAERRQPPAWPLPSQASPPAGLQAWDLGGTDTPNTTQPRAAAQGAR